LLKIKGLEHYYLYHTSVGEIYFELNNKETAKKYYQSALQLASTRQEKELLKTKIRHCENV
jgi:predicted RNA polymerase sigma factor